MLKIVKSSPRAGLYYKEHSYAMNFNIRDASALRTLNHDAINKYLRYRYTSKGYTDRWGGAGPSEQETINLHDMCDRLKALKSPHKKMVSYGHIYLYNSDLDELETIASAPYINCKTVTQADDCLPENTVILTNPKRKFRTYFKDRWVGESQTPLLRKFLLNRRDCYDFTPLFKDRLTHWDKFYTMSHFFIDHDDPKDLLMLELVVPGLIRKTLPIVAK